MSIFSGLRDVFRKHPSPRPPFTQRDLAGERDAKQKEWDEHLDWQGRQAAKEADRDNSLGDY